MLVGDKGFSPPKGIRCFSTTPEYRQAQSLRGFQSPEGDSLFFYEHAIEEARASAVVSVPRRGFVVFLPVFPNSAQIILVRVFWFQSPEGDSLFFYSQSYRVERLDLRKFQSPEGDSLFFYMWWLVKSAALEKRKETFQSPEGDSLFFYQYLRSLFRFGLLRLRFSPPKGIRCFSTKTFTKR